MNDVEHHRDASRFRGWLQGGLGAVLALGAYQIYEFVQPSAPPIAYAGGSVVAAAELDYVLDDPSQGGGASGMTAGKLFATGSDDKCRRFAQGYISGSACFRDGQWRLVEMKQEPLPRDD